MLPLALIVRAEGCAVAGSDRSLDQGRLAPKFDFLRARGIALFPAGRQRHHAAPTRSSSPRPRSRRLCPTWSGRAAARRAPVMRRAELLAELFNAAPHGIAVGGTSGKSTVTGMIGWILHAPGRDPTVMNGAVMKNFVTPDVPFASALVGQRRCFVSEVDESDGSIALYRPTIAVLNNITLDHKSLDELRAPVPRLRRQGARSAVLNLDDDETAPLAASLPAEQLITYASPIPRRDLFGAAISTKAPVGIAFDGHRARRRRDRAGALQVPGRHNVSNALAALARGARRGRVARDAAAALAGFSGLSAALRAGRRRRTASP